MNIITEIERNLSKVESLFEAETVILKGMMNVAQHLMRIFLESLDDTLLHEATDSRKVINKQPRTLNFIFGPVTFDRRYYQIEGKGKEFYLDKKLSIEPRRRLSPHYQMLMGKIGQLTTMRNTADILNLIFDSGITADSVMHAVHELGKRISVQTQITEQQTDKRRVPENLTIEGDAFMIRIQKQGKTPARTVEVHHYRIYERAGGELINKRDFLGLGERKQVENRVRAYLDHQYDLKGQTVFLGSDAGPGYEPQKMMDLVPITATGVYFIDRYHCFRKIETTLGRQNELAPRAVEAVRETN